MNRVFTKAQAEQVKEDYLSGMSVRSLAAKYECAKSTISTYVRDVVRTPSSRRKYESEQEARAAGYRRSKAHTQEFGRKKYASNKSSSKPCPICGKSIKMESKLCVACYRRIGAEAAVKRGEAAQAEKERVQKQREQYRAGSKVIIVEECEKSSSQRHHWVISLDGTGKCKFCQKINTFPTPVVQLESIRR